MKWPVFLGFVAIVCITNQSRADDAACIAASEQSLSLRQQGKLHDTLQQLATCADVKCPGEVREECARRINDVNSAMPTLIFGAKDGAGNDRDRVTVKLDGVAIATVLDGRSIAIDPGEHTVRFEATGEAPLEKKIVVREGEKDRREIVQIGAPVQAPPPPTTTSFWNAQRGIALGAMGLGVVGVALGGWFGAFAISAKNQEAGDCPAANCIRYLQAAADYNTANQDATASTISFIAGGVLAATGIVLWITSPRVHVVPSASARGVSFALEGSF